MLHQTILQIRQDVTFPHVAVAIILGSIGRFAWEIEKKISKIIRKEETTLYRKIRPIKKTKGIDPAQPLAASDSPWLFQ